MAKRDHKGISDIEELVLMSRGRGFHRWLPRRIRVWVLRYNREHKEWVKKLELMEYGETQEIKQVNWKAILVVSLWVLLLPLIPLLAYFIYKMPQLLVANQALKLTDNEWLQRTNEARATIVQAIGGLILLIGLFFTWRNIRVMEKNLKISQDATTKNLEIAQEGLVTQRFSKAIELLGSDKIDVRLGGIYALERIARESRKDHWPTMEILTAFVRENSPWEKGEPPKQVRTDIQAVLTVLGRRKTEHEQIGLRRSFSESRRLDLHGTNLHGADLYGANLAGVNLSEANLMKSKMLNTNLGFAILDNADLSDSKITASNFEDADLNGTRFNRTLFFEVKFDSSYVNENRNEPTVFECAEFKACSLRGAAFLKGNFRSAKFWGGSLAGAKLKGADFTGATFDLIQLEGVDLKEVEGLIKEQINKAGVEYETTNLPARIQDALVER